ncbi:cytochrome c oxidase biogenesis protein Cmc1 like-domain-containing protein [Triangularia verruculosa]|uniref:COX assembly mitochondrial protein n=1 Tax=Triangularia verruculosa TaxID=2587418 RepID=A0AAN7AUN1_9PEZI|nr:cytochrome c oxidase biogenesis protein Cmc1 like-domain-containing protein [Triangularia verruculosa]
MTSADSPPAAAAPSEQKARPIPSRNPLPLSASQESQVRDVFYARVRAKCGPEIKAFAECAQDRTFSSPFLCRGPLHVMNNCMKIHATPEEQDAAREEWFEKRVERQKEKERKARRKLEQEKFLREWWGLPEKDRELARKEMELLDKPERIGGFVSRERRRFNGEDGEGKR